MNVCCPQCGDRFNAVVQRTHRELLFYICPCCKGKAVHYKGRDHLVDDDFLKRLAKTKRLVCCGRLHEAQVVSDEYVAELHQLLSSEMDSSAIIAKL